MLHMRNCFNIISSENALENNKIDYIEFDNSSFFNMSEVGCRVEKK